MKNYKLFYNITSISIMLLLSAFPLLKILINVKHIDNIYLNIGSIVYFLVLILFVLGASFQLITLIMHTAKSDFTTSKKALWISLLILFNIFVMPYFYTKYVVKERNAELKALIYLVPMLFSLFVSIFGVISYDRGLAIVKEMEAKKAEEEANEKYTFQTKDGAVAYTFGHGYKVSNVGEYDLYVINDEKKIVFTAFTYETENYEQQTPEDYINKGINDIKKDKEKFDIFKEKEVTVLEDKTINSVVYVGKTKESALCMYIISATTFNAKPNYIVYSVEVVTKLNYDKVANELYDILKSATIK